MGQEGHAMLFDCRTFQESHARIPNGISIIIVNSGVFHTLTDGGYASRFAECKAAVEIIKKTYQGIRSLRDVTQEMLSMSRKDFTDPVFFKRALHVVSENARAVAFYQALKSGALGTVGQIMYEGHESLKCNFNVTVPETDAIVDIAKGTDGVWGARMTGGGFGGAVCILVESDKAEAALKDIMQRYLPIFERHRATKAEHVSYSSATAFIAQTSSGACVYKPVV